jgi:hypothetical protein
MMIEMDNANGVSAFEVQLEIDDTGRVCQVFTSHLILNIV